MAEFVTTETVGEVVVVRLERPPANAMSPQLLDEGADLVAELRSDPPAAVVIAGSGGFFSGGIDLKLAPTLSAEEQAGMVPRINRIFCEWYGFPRPVVAAVTGHAVAGGLILALCADYRVASTAGAYGLTEARVGVPYPVAALGIVRAELAPPVVRRLVLGASLIDAATAREWDVFDELTEPAQVLERALAVAGEFAALPSATYELVKGQLRGETTRALRAAAEADPVAGGWLSDETPDAARSVLNRG
jgi:enoyl-CoA hydratase